MAIYPKDIQVVKDQQSKETMEQDEDWLELPGPPTAAAAAAAVSAKAATPSTVTSVHSTSHSVLQPPVAAPGYATAKYGLLNKKQAAPVLTVPGEVAAAGGDCVASIHILPPTAVPARQQTALGQQAFVAVPAAKGPLLARHCQPLV
jgi:hypothetical protein